LAGPWLAIELASLRQNFSPPGFFLPSFTGFRGPCFQYQVIPAGAYNFSDMKDARVPEISTVKHKKPRRECQVKLKNQALRSGKD
jgi:hypothetical protein